MSDDTAFTWSSYDQHRTRIEYETRHKIAEVIEQKIEQARSRGVTNHFISGMELGLAVVLDLHKEGTASEEQPELF
jgi:hypothetical protein